MKTSLLAMVVLFITASCSTEEITNIDQVGYTIDLSLAQETDWEFAAQILVLINQHRSSMGLEPIFIDQEYASAYSVDHTLYMIDKKRISHDNFETRSAALKSNGADTVGENVAFGYTNAEDLVNAWLNSESHRRIIEGPYNYSGFGILKDNRGRYYFTQLFYRK